MYETPNCIETKLKEPLAPAAAFLSRSVDARLHCPSNCNASAASTKRKSDAKHTPAQWQTSPSRRPQHPHRRPRKASSFTMLLWNALALMEVGFVIAAWGNLVVCVPTHSSSTPLTRPVTFVSCEGCIAAVDCSLTGPPNEVIVIMGGYGASIDGLWHIYAYRDFWT